MINPRTSTELWDDELDAPMHYPHATRRRALIAHSLGVLGVLGTLTLGVAAIVPHLSYIEQRAHNLLARQPAVQALHRFVSPTPAPSTPAVTAQNSAPPLAPVQVVSPPPVAPPQETPNTLSAAPSPSDTSPAASATESPASATEPQAPAPVDTVAAPAPEKAAPAPSAAATAAPAEADTPAKTLANKPAADEGARPVASMRPARTEPRLTWAEIERRKARYAEWLKQQGLEEVH
jgi:hypothetical protein